MNKLKISFRVFPDGDVIALFIKDICDPHGNWTSYMRIGQHGPASPELMEDLEEAMPEQYASLLTELKSIYKPKRVTTSGIPGDCVIFHEVQDE